MPLKEQENSSFYLEDFGISCGKLQESSRTTATARKACSASLASSSLQKVDAHLKIDDLTKLSRFKCLQLRVPAIKFLRSNPHAQAGPIRMDITWEASEPFSVDMVKLSPKRGMQDATPAGGTLTTYVARYKRELDALEAWRQYQARISADWLRKSMDGLEGQPDWRSQEEKAIKERFCKLQPFLQSLPEDIQGEVYDKLAGELHWDKAAMLYEEFTETHVSIFVQRCHVALRRSGGLRLGAPPVCPCAFCSAYYGSKDFGCHSSI